MTESNEKIETNFDIDVTAIDRGIVKLAVAKSVLPKKKPEGDLVQFKQAMLTTNDALQIALTAARKAGLNDPTIKHANVSYINAKTGVQCRTLQEMQQGNIDLSLVVTIHSDTLMATAMIGDSIIR